jgi:ADP-ribosyl-[dinitrogen reductase] hydrolase
MALYLAVSLIAQRDFVPYDQLVRYKWWYRYGYLSSIGKCFDIGAATQQAVEQFLSRQKTFAKEKQLGMDTIDDYAAHRQQLANFYVKCGDENAAGNGSLMRLAAVPLFFHRQPARAVQYCGESSSTTHGDQRAIDACRFYGPLIVAALQQKTKAELLSDTFVEDNRDWFGNETLHEDIMAIAKGSYKKKASGHADGIRGTGFVVNALEAALWAFNNNGGSFEKGVLAAINLGDDTDTTAAIYGQVAGAHYGLDNIPGKWWQQLYAQEFIRCLSAWLMSEGQQWSGKNERET